MLARLTPRVIDISFYNSSYYIVSVLLHCLLFLLIPHRSIVPDRANIEVSIRDISQTKPKHIKPGNLLPKLDFSQPKTKPHYDIDGSQDDGTLSDFKYFTYADRIRQQLSQHWIPLVKEKITEIRIQGRNPTGELVTRCAVVLDNTGKVLSVRIVKSCGIEGIDSAAVKSFLEVGSFPNPPKDLVNHSGCINILWEFIAQPGLVPDKRRRRIRL